MEDFDNLMKQAVSIKTSQMVQKRKKFEGLPLFIKAGLYYLAKFNNVRRQGFYQRYAVCDHLKVRGNKLFKEEKTEQAAREYEQALSIFRYIINKNPNWKNEGILDEDLEYINFDGEGEEENTLATTIKVALYNNLAACYLNMKDYQNAKAACDEALILDPMQTKALYRRAKALTSDVNAGVEEYKAAMEDLKKALELSPDDPIIQQSLVKTKHEFTKVKNSGQTFKGIFQKEKTEGKTSGDPVIEKQKSVTTPSSTNSTSTPPTTVEKNETVSKQKPESPKKVQEQKREEPKEVKEEKYIETKKGRVIEERKENEIKEAPKKATPPSSETPNQKLDKNNEVWKMLHGDKDPNSNDYDYNLSYATKDNAEVPNEIAELERFLEKRGNELLKLYESSGKTQQAQELKENLKKAMAAKQRLEKIATLDFDQPNAQLKEVAEKFGLDLSDPAIKDELKKVQTQNLEDIRNWINGMSGEDKKSGDKTKKIEKGKDKSKMKKKVGTENVSAENVTMTNNYFINNNYYSGGPEGLDQILGDPVSKSKIMEDMKEQQSQYAKSVENNKLLSDLLENVSKLKETDSNSKVNRIMNLVIIAVAIGLFLISLFMQTNRSNGISGRPDGSRDI